MKEEKERVNKGNNNKKEILDPDQRKTVIGSHDSVRVEENVGERSGQQGPVLYM